MVHRKFLLLMAIILGVIALNGHIRCDSNANCAAEGEIDFLTANLDYGMTTVVEHSIYHIDSNHTVIDPPAVQVGGKVLLKCYVKEPLYPKDIACLENNNQSICDIRFNVPRWSWSDSITDRFLASDVSLSDYITNCGFEPLIDKEHDDYILISIIQIHHIDHRYEGTFTCHDNREHGDIVLKIQGKRFSS